MFRRTLTVEPLSARSKPGQDTLGETETGSQWLGFTRRNLFPKGCFILIVQSIRWHLWFCRLFLFFLSLRCKMFFTTLPGPTGKWNLCMYICIHNSVCIIYIYIYMLFHCVLGAIFLGTQFGFAARRATWAPQFWRVPRRASELRAAGGGRSGAQGAVVGELSVLTRVTPEKCLVSPPNNVSL